MTWDGVDRRKQRRPLEADPEMWAAFRNGPGLREVLLDFYTVVLADERMAPFFEGVTREHIVQKQFNFLRSVFTGEKCYFGNRPRNAHHWMVIDDELFDYRESLMEAALQRYGLDTELIARIRTLDESFRKQIVKAEPRPLKLRGVEQPLEGFEAIELSVGTICDECDCAIEPGEHAVYHVRTGRTWCLTCKSLTDAGIDQDAAGPGASH
jgi:truncated hemoglobin YjbI